MADLSDVRTFARESRRILGRHGFKGVLVGLATLAVVGIAYVVLPRTYESEAKLFVRVGQTSVTLDPTATTGQTVALQENRETEINSILEILTSRQMLDEVVRRLGPDVILGEATYDPAVAQVSRWEARETAADRARQSDSDQSNSDQSNSDRPQTEGTRLASGGEVGPTGIAPVGSDRADHSVLRPATRAMSETLTQTLPTGTPAPGGESPMARSGSASRQFGFDDAETYMAAERDLLHAKAVRALQDQVEFHIPKRSTVLQVRAEAEDPRLAQRIVAEIVAIFQSEHLRVNRIAGSYDFFEAQAAETQDRLTEAQDRLRQIKDRVGVARLDEQKSQLHKRMTDLESAEATARANLAASRAKLSAIERAIAELPQTQVTLAVRGFANEGSDRMRERLYNLEVQEKQLQAIAKANHPELAAIRRQIAEARRILDDRPDERTQTTESIHPARTKLEVDQATERASEAALSAQAAELAAQRDRVITELKTLNAAEVDLRQAEDDVAVLEAARRGYAEKLEQARIQAALLAGAVSNINVIQSASFVPKPIFPKLSLLAALGVLAAITGGLATPFLIDYFDTSLTTAEQVERRLHVPVLMTVTPPRPGAVATPRAGSDAARPHSVGRD